MQVTAENVLELDHLSRQIEAKKIVDDVSFTVRRGEILAITGPSGSGKSSLLRLLNRLDEPTSGTFRVEGRDFREFSPRDLRRSVGMVMQSSFLFPGTITDNLRFGPMNAGHTLSDTDVSALLNEVGLPGYDDRTVANLSGGEAQRVSFARALANSPVVLLADEPTSALDEISKLAIEKVLIDVVRNHGLTCLVVTHDVAQATRIADRVAVLSAGCLHRIGSPSEVFHAQRT